MTNLPRIALLYGGVSAEREVSLGSGKAALAALEKSFQVDAFDIVSQERLPEGLDPARHVVFSTLHGSFGEDGRMQGLLDAAGVIYAGCDAAASALTFDKVATKAVIAKAGVPVAPQIVFSGGRPPSVSEIVAQVGESVVLKPVAQGSSVGLAFAEGAAELEKALEQCREGAWLIERRIVGREATIGLLNGRPLEIVEIVPKSGRYDYASKYTKGMCVYHAPADFNEDLTGRIKKLATDAFAACGCRDYARIDLMVSEIDDPVFLEINTLPGLKETSLLPMSAAACGIDFCELLQKLVEPALLRYRVRYSKT